MIIYGMHTVAAVLESDHKIRTMHILERDSAERADDLVKTAREKRVDVRFYSQKDKQGFIREFKRAGGVEEDASSAQGVFLEIADPQLQDLEALIQGVEPDTRPYPLVVLLDEISDPQNLGSILRSAAAFGAMAVVITEHRSSPLNAVAARISSGGFAFVPVCKVVNLGQALETLKEKGFWVVGMSEHAKDPLETVRLDAPICLVIGSEEKGIRNLTAKSCDWLVSLPTSGKLQSLNAAVACASALALVRQGQRNLS
jgi:23S rRNA (guanosine2251-2'-O)-methyltransferase